MTLGPLTVTGSSFGSGERITVLANVPPRVVSRQTVAARDGSFIVRFEDITGTPHGLRVRAMGSEGNAALYAPRPQHTN